MPLVKMKQLLEEASKENRACGAFSVGNMEMVRGAIRAAEELNTPIILQIAEVRLPYSPLHIIGGAMIQAAKEAKVDIAVHFDHGLTFDTVKKALELGFTSVMLDASTCPFDENVEKVKEVIALAKKYGATVEAELGLVGGSEDGREDHGIRKVNIATSSFQSLVKYVEQYMNEENKHNYFDLSETMVQGTYENVKHHMKVFNME